MVNIMEILNNMPIWQAVVIGISAGALLFGSEYALNKCLLKYFPEEEQNLNEKPNTEGTIYGIQLETSEGPDPVLGDLDQDGQVTVADMVLLRRFLIGKSDLTADVATVADLNADEKINAIDLVLIKYILLNPAE